MPFPSHSFLGVPLQRRDAALAALAILVVRTFQHFWRTMSDLVA